MPLVIPIGKSRRVFLPPRLRTSHRKYHEAEGALSEDAYDIAQMLTTAMYRAGKIDEIRIVIHQVCIDADPDS